MSGPKVEVNFAPTPVYIEGFGVEMAKRQAREIVKSRIDERMDEFLGQSEEEDIVSNEVLLAQEQLKLGIILLVSGFFLGFSLGHMLWGR